MGPTSVWSLDHVELLVQIAMEEHDEQREQEEQALLVELGEEMLPCDDLRPHSQLHNYGCFSIFAGINLNESCW